MKKITFLGSILVTVISSTTAMAAEPAADQFLAMSQVSGNVVPMTEDQLSTVEGAGGYGGLDCNGTALSGGLIGVSINLSCNSVQLLSGLGILGPGTATSTVN